MTDVKQQKSMDELFGLDQAKEEEGVWFPLIGTNGERTGCEVKVAAADSKRSRRLQAQIARERRLEIRVDADITDEIAVEIMAKSVLLDWKGLCVPSEDGEVSELPYTEENAIKVLLEFKVIREQVSRYSTTRAAFAKSYVREAKKKSATS